MRILHTSPASSPGFGNEPARHGCPGWVHSLVVGSRLSATRQEQAKMIIWRGRMRDESRSGRVARLPRALRKTPHNGEDFFWKLFLSANEILSSLIHLGCHEMNHHKPVPSRFTIGHLPYRTRGLPAMSLTQFARTAVRSSLLSCHSQPVQLPLPRAPSHATTTLIYHLFWPPLFQRTGDLQSAEQLEGTSVHLPWIDRRPAQLKGGLTRRHPQ